MDTLKKTLSSYRHLVSLGGHDFQVPDQFDYHLKDRNELYKFHFLRFKGAAPARGDRRFRLGKEVPPVRLKAEGIQKKSSPPAGGADPAGDLFEVWGEIAVEYFPTETQRILVHSPGEEGGVQGINGHFMNIGRILKQDGCGSLVSHRHSGMAQLLGDGRLTLEAMVSDLQDVLDFCIKTAFSMCKSISPQWYLSGFSRGGAAAAVAGSTNRQVEKMLLISPFADKRIDLVLQALAQYRGELHITHGQMDEVVPIVYSKNCIQAARKAKKADLVAVQKCGHRFANPELQQEFIHAFQRVFAAGN